MRRPRAVAALSRRCRLHNFYATCVITPPPSVGPLRRLDRTHRKTQHSIVETMAARSILLSLILFLAPPASRAAGQTCPSNEQMNLRSIEILGTTRTSTGFIKRELRLGSHEKVCESQILDGINRIKRTGLFSKVDYHLLKQDGPADADLKIMIGEKWTTIPILKVNSGGGVSQYTLGVYDPHIYGEFLEAGAQYENLGGASSGVVWFKNPRLWGEFQGIDLQYWNTKRIRIQYDQGKDDPEITQGFLQEREKLYFDYSREVSSAVTFRISFDYNKDSFSTRILPNSVLERIGQNPILPPSTELLISKLGLEFGRIDGEPQALRGQVLGAHFGYAHSLDDRADPFIQGDLSFNLFRSISPRLQFAQRLLAGATTTKAVQYLHYLGGLDRVRGFADNRFFGSHFALSNSEGRYLFLAKSSYLVQGVGFADFGAIGDEASALRKIRAASVGAGLRLILPKIYRFVVRLDYAQTILKNDATNWSFGVQQFF